MAKFEFPAGPNGKTVVVSFTDATTARLKRFEEQLKAAGITPKITHHES